jgi:very-short-patch-repair endonuclease
MRRKSQPDLAIAATAERQHGVISHPQLVALGLSREAIQRRVRAGRLHRIHQGVYAVGHRRLTQRGRWSAAVLAGGAGAVLSHGSAAALWQLLPARGEIHVTVRRTLRKRDMIRFHSQSLQFDEVTTHDGLAATTVARTLLDIAGTDPNQFERAYNEAEYRRLADPVGLAKLVSRYPARAGTPLIQSTVPRGRTRFELESRFLALVEEQGLLTPEFNAAVELEPGRWIEADCLWRDARLIVELDGRAAHETTSRFDSDRERDRLLALAGYRVVRVTWRHLNTDGGRLAGDLRTLMRR